MYFKIILSSVVMEDPVPATNETAITSIGLYDFAVTSSVGAVLVAIVAAPLLVYGGYLTPVMGSTVAITALIYVVGINIYTAIAANDNAKNSQGIDIRLASSLIASFVVLGGVVIAWYRKRLFVWI